MIQNYFIINLSSFGLNFKKPDRLIDSLDLFRFRLVSSDCLLKVDFNRLFQIRSNRLLQVGSGLQNV